MEGSPEDGAGEDASEITKEEDGVSSSEQK